MKRFFAYFWALVINYDLHIYGVHVNAAWALYIFGRYMMNIVECSCLGILGTSIVLAVLG